MERSSGERPGLQHISHFKYNIVCTSMQIHGNPKDIKQHLCSRVYICTYMCTYAQTVVQPRCVRNVCEINRVWGEIWIKSLFPHTYIYTL